MRSRLLFDVYVCFLGIPIHCSYTVVVYRRNIIYLYVSIYVPLTEATTEDIMIEHLT